jgi:hypothetical protein
VGLFKALEEKVDKAETYLQYLFIEGYKEFCFEGGFLSHQKFNSAVSAFLVSRQLTHATPGASVASAGAPAPAPEA